MRDHGQEAGQSTSVGESDFALPASERSWCGIVSEDYPLNYCSIEEIRSKKVLHLINALKSKRQT